MTKSITFLILVAVFELSVFTAVRWLVFGGIFVLIVRRQQLIADENTCYRIIKDSGPLCHGSNPCEAASL